MVVFAIHWHESAMGVHVSPSWTPSHLPSHPSLWVVPVLRLRCGLVIYFTYGNIHVSVLFSQIILESYETRGLMLQCLVKGMVWHGTVTGDQPQHIFCPSSIICKGMAKLPHIEFRIICDLWSVDMDLVILFPLCKNL